MSDDYKLQSHLIAFASFNHHLFCCSRIHSWKEQRRCPRTSRVSQPLNRQNSRNAIQHKSTIYNRQYSHSPLVKSYSSPSPNSPRSSTSGSGGGRIIRTTQGKTQTGLKTLQV